MSSGDRLIHGSPPSIGGNELQEGRYRAIVHWPNGHSSEEILRVDTRYTEGDWRSAGFPYLEASLTVNVHGMAVRINTHGLTFCLISTEPVADEVALFVVRASADGQ